MCNCIQGKHVRECVTQGARRCVFQERGAGESFGNQEYFLKFVVVK